MSIVEKLKGIFPPEQISDHPAQLDVASHDESTLNPTIPLAVVWATNVDEIIRLVKLCLEQKIPITTRGAGSALEGSTIPLPNGIVLDLSQMTKIINFWPDDLQVQVEPGIIYNDLNNHLKNEGLFFPPSPGGSGDIATIGGMVSTNASGIYSVKYGGTRNYVLELEIVTGTGEKIKIGNRAIKRSSGYNMVDLIAGSEGTLAIITAVTLQLAGLPEGRLQNAYKFKNETDAAKAVSEICKYGLDIAAIEFLDKNVMTALNMLKDYKLEEVPTLFFEFHGSPPAIQSNNELAESICEELNGQKLILSDGQHPWEIRHDVTDAIKYRKPGYTIIRNDVAFPISKLPEMVAYCYQLSEQYKIMIHAFGHVGMGLLHALILANKEDKQQWENAQKINEMIIKKALTFDGTISGEHGIGLGHKDLFELEHGEAVDLMRKIKKQFDPSNILNPGKIFNI